MVEVIFQLLEAMLANIIFRSTMLLPLPESFMLVVFDDIPIIETVAALVNCFFLLVLQGNMVVVAF